MGTKQLNNLIEDTHPPPQFGLWQLLVIVGCCGVAFAGWRKNLELLQPIEAVVFAVAIAALAPGLFILFRYWTKSWSEATVVLLIATVLFAAVAPEPRNYGEGRREQCANNLKQIGIALQTYHDVYKCFPPAYIADERGRPMHSWRVLLLPFLEQQPLYVQYRFDEPWNGPNNSRLHQEVVEIYQCPGSVKDPANRDDTETSYVVVVGPHTAFAGTRAISLNEIKDDISTVIAVVEVKSSGIHWMEPRDLHVTQMATQVNAPRGQGISSKHLSGPQVLTADGAVRILSPTTTSALLRNLLTTDDGEPAPEQWPYQYAH